MDQTQNSFFKKVKFINENTITKSQCFAFLFIYIYI